jgi:hypothetical protein
MAERNVDYLLPSDRAQRARNQTAIYVKNLTATIDETRQMLAESRERVAGGRKLMARVRAH